LNQKTMPTTAAAEKARIRQEVRGRLEKISAEDRKENSARACGLLMEQPAWGRAGSVMLYAPATGELDIWPVAQEALGQGKMVAIPRYAASTDSYEACEVKDLSRDLIPGRYGIREASDQCKTVALKRLDLILVPGVAFDLQGRRLGRGKGYYDRLLAAVRGQTCGVAFDEQIVLQLPVEPHDSDVNWILTPTRWIEL
jgi:5-formyltetrahydrofolate cyclo-ligase